MPLSPGSLKPGVASTAPFADLCVEVVEDTGPGLGLVRMWEFFFLRGMCAITTVSPHNAGNPKRDELTQLPCGNGRLRIS